MKRQYANNIKLNEIMYQINIKLTSQQLKPQVNI